MKVEIHVMFPGFCTWAPAKKVHETLPVHVLPPQLQRLLFPHVFVFDVNCQGGVVIDSRKYYLICRSPRVEVGGCQGGKGGGFGTFV